MVQTSAGILMWRRRLGIEVLLVHFGGPYWRNKDEGAWAIPKGLIEPGESPRDAALREFEEELGSRPAGELVTLGRIRQKGGKWVEAYALQGEFDPANLISTTFTVEWPPRSGSFRSWPEVDKAAWFDLESARAKILPSQRSLLDLLEGGLASGSLPDRPAKPAHAKRG